jgi:hypothetical protein
VVFTSGTTGNQAARVDSTTLTFNATTNVLTVTASFASQSLSSSYALSSSFATSASYTLSSSFATSASYALSSSFATSASFAVTAAYAPNAGGIAGGSTNYVARWASATTLTTGSIFDSGSNVGIGTTSPTATLTVSKAASNFIFDLDNATETEFKLRTYNSGSSGVGTAVFTQGLYYIANENGAIKFHRGSGGTDGFLTFSTTATERLRIDAAGNVGIGTTPSTKLHIIGSASIAVDGSSQDTSPYAPLGVTRADTAANLSYIGMTKTGVIPWGIGISSNSSNSSLIVGPVTANTQVIAAPIMSWNYTNNRVGINTTSSAGNLHVYDTNDPASTLVGQVQIGGNNNISNDIYLSIGTHKTGEYAFLNAAKGGVGSRPLALMGGNVGIGTTSPQTALDINGRLSFTSASVSTIFAERNGNYHVIYSPTGNPGIYIGNAVDNGNYYDNGSHQFRSAGGGTYYAVITTAGKVGIGTTSPEYKLHVEGSATIDTTGTEDILILGRALTVATSFQQAASLKLGRYQNAGGSFESYTRLDFALRDNSATSNYNTNTTVMTLTNAGNVGIGTTSPSSLLTVAGNISSSAAVYFKGLTTTNQSNVVTIDTATGQLYYTASSAFGGGGGASLSGGKTNYNTIWSSTTTISTGSVYQYSSTQLQLTGSSLSVGDIIPSTTPGRIDASNDIVAYSSSDKRFKINITPITNALEKITQIGGYKFDWIENPEHHGFKGHDVGVIAQEIEAVLPEVVATRDSGYKAVKYEKIVPLLIEAIKEQQQQINNLLKQINKLTNGH